MWKTVGTFLIVVVMCFLGSHLVEISQGAASSVDLDSVKRACKGNIVECTEGEVMVDSESSKRVLLMQRRYISYDTLTRDLVPCDRPGASYYNCRGPGVANFYSRGCEIITRCARGD